MGRVSEERRSLARELAWEKSRYRGRWYRKEGERLHQRWSLILRIQGRDKMASGVESETKKSGRLD